MKRLSLRPYPGEILLFDDLKAFKLAYRRLTGIPHEADGIALGRTVQIMHKNGGLNYLIYVKGRRPATLVHELSHVVLMLFLDIGIVPSSGNGEPFCYLLDRLFTEARA